MHLEIVHKHPTDGLLSTRPQVRQHWSRVGYKLHLLAPGVTWD